MQDQATPRGGLCFFQILWDLSGIAFGTKGKWKSGLFIKTHLQHWKQMFAFTLCILLKTLWVLCLEIQHKSTSLRSFNFLVQHSKKAKEMTDWRKWWIDLYISSAWYRKCRAALGDNSGMYDTVKNTILPQAWTNIKTPSQRDATEGGHPWDYEAIYTTSSTALL